MNGRAAAPWLRCNMLFFDQPVVSFLNSFARRSLVLDRVVAFVAGSPLLKGGLFMALFSYAWFRPGTDASVRRTRGVILATFAGTFLGLLIARSMAVSLPYTARPLCSPGFVLPAGISSDDAGAFRLMSSFPSDHATLFVGLATGLMMVSRRMGLIGFFLFAFVVGFPRIYLGYHWPSDLIGGGALGAICVLGTISISEMVGPAKLLERILNWTERYPGSFYAFAYLITYEIVELFITVRGLIHFRAIADGIAHLGGF